MSHHGSRSPRMMGTQAVRISAALLALAACAGEDGGREALDAVHFIEWDSAGIRIVESSGTALETPLPWVVDTLASLELGQIQGDTPTQFHNIGGIVGLPDGGLIVVDGASRELRWFEASGEYLRNAGGTGQGPGEFLNPLLVPQFGADSLLIFDRARRAFTWVAMDGSGTRTLGNGGQVFVGLPIAAANSRALFRSAPGSGACPENVGCDVPLLLRAVEVDGAVADTLIMYPYRMMLFTDYGPGLLLTGVLHQRGVAAAGPDGLVVEGDPRFELRQFDSGGRLIAILRVDASPRSTLDNALEQHVRGSSDPDELTSMYERMGLPEVVPAFQALKVDHLGWYWAEFFRPTVGGVSEWLVFDREGRARGTVEMPSGLDVHEVGEDYVLGRWVDELGIEHVRRHTLDRRGN